MFPREIRRDKNEKEPTNQAIHTHNNNCQKNLFIKKRKNKINESGKTEAKNTTKFR